MVWWDLDRVDPSAVAHAVALEAPDVVDRIRAHAPDGVDRVVEVSLSDNADLDAQVLANGGVLAAYVSRADRPELPFWPLLFANATLRPPGQRRPPGHGRGAGGHGSDRRGPRRVAVRPGRRDPAAGRDRRRPRPGGRRRRSGPPRRPVTVGVLYRTSARSGRGILTPSASGHIRSLR